MTDPRLEIERLRSNLQLKGFSANYVQEVCNRASREISEAISDGIANALQEATEAGIEVDAEQFIAELRAVYIGNSFEIVTDSGQTDFSEPPFPMLQSLLRNPKVAKDGSLYKVIPVGASNGQSRSTTSLMDAQQNIAIAKVQSDNSASLGDPVAGAMQFSGTFSAMKSAQRNASVKSAVKQKNSRGVKFRTASSKQDNTKQWVQPAKDKNMAGVLDSVNSKLRNYIEESVMGIIESYEEV